MFVLQWAVWVVLLTMDGFLISLPIGISKDVTRDMKVRLVYLFFGFAFIFTILGTSLVASFTVVFDTLISMISVIVIIGLGLHMILSAKKLKKTKPSVLPNRLTLRLSILYALSGSLDSLMAGSILLPYLTSTYMNLIFALFVGVMAALLSLFGLFLGKHLSDLVIFESYADYIGGVLLIMFALYNLWNLFN